MDALTHNLEAYVAKGDHPLADAIAVDGLRRIAGHLKRAVQNGKDIEAREQMLLGSAFGAIAFQKGLGACHSVAHALTPVAGTHHGLANSLMLPAVVNFRIMPSLAPENKGAAISMLNLGAAASAWLGPTIVALFISGGQYQPLTKRMFTALRDEIDPTIAAISTLMTAVSFMLVLVVSSRQKKDA